MNLSEAICGLPVAPDGYIRAIRIEAVGCVTVGAGGAAHSARWSGWERFKEPWGDGAPPGFRIDGKVCATYPHNFHDWFAPNEIAANRLPEYGYRVVALNVPVDDSTVMCREQVVFDRRAAKEVAVLLH